jgi:hypothetical protein
MSTSLPQSDNFRNSDAPQKTKPAPDWRLPLEMGLSIGLALPAARGVGIALESSLGSGVAFLVGLVVAGAVGGLVGATVSWLIRSRRPADQ